MGPFEDKYNVNEGETVFVTLKLEPGDPIPTSEQIEWIKNGSKDMSVFPRCKLYTNGENNMGPKECKKADDEGDFTIITTVGIANVEFKLFVIVVGGMDFRAMLLKTKVKQKILVLTRIGWILVTTAKKENRRKV